MDEIWRRKGLWIGLAVVGLIFLCVIACVLGPLMMLVPRQTVTYAPAPYVAPQAGEEGAAPQVYREPIVSRQNGLGLLGIIGFGFRTLFKLMLFGLLLMLGLHLVRHLFWGSRRWCAPYWGPYYRGKPPAGPIGATPEGDEDEAGWGPSPWTRRAWRHHRHHWGPPPWWGPGPEQAAEKTDANEQRSDASEDAYTGPQE